MELKVELRTMLKLLELLKREDVRLGFAVPVGEEERTRAAELVPEAPLPPTPEGVEPVPCDACGMQIVPGPNVKRISTHFLCPFCVALLCQLGLNVDSMLARQEQAMGEDDHAEAEVVEKG